MANHLPKFPISSRNPNILKLNPKKSTKVIEAKVARLQQLMGKQTKDLIKEANQIGLEFLQQEALKSLQGSMRQARAPFRTGRLEEAIVNPKYSKADGIGIRFLIDALIRPKVPYFAALEYGDHHSVGRQIPFIFLGTKRGGHDSAGNSPDASKAAYKVAKAPTPSRANGVKPEGEARHDGPLRSGRLADRGVGPREIRKLEGRVGPVHATLHKDGKITGEGVFLVTIKRPVPDYGYVEAARKEFFRRRFYHTTLNRLITASPLDQAGVKFVLTGR